jgi:hypothetical protein
VEAVDVVVLPEGAVAADMIDTIEGVLARRGVGALVTGVRDVDVPLHRQPSNWVHLGVLLGGRWWHYRQNKHHRWSLDENQILQYHLGEALPPGVRWWEAMDVPRRSIQFIELGPGLTVVAVICEDLARLDAVADLLRTVGPTLVLNVLLDGPQLTSRWTARYASVLADDPGSAVLTLTAFGMVDRSRPPGFAPSRVVALWKDPASGFREISLDPGAAGVLLSTRIDGTTRYTADGRWPADNATNLRDVGVQQVRAPAGGAAVLGTEPSAPPHRARTSARLDERDLTVLSSWAAAYAEASGPDEVNAVAAEAAPGASWRGVYGVAKPSPALADALTTLAGVAAGQLGAEPTDIVATVWDLARAGRPRRAGAPAR